MRRAGTLKDISRTVYLVVAQPLLAAGGADGADRSDAAGHILMANHKRIEAEFPQAGHRFFMLGQKQHQIGLKCEDRFEVRQNHL